MKAYYNTLNEREKCMVIGAALCVFIYIYYFFLFAPLSKQVELKSNLLTEKISTLKWMGTIKHQKPQGRVKPILGNSQLLSAVASQLKSSVISKFTYQLQQTSSGEVQLMFNKVSFNQFFAWLAKVNEQYAITIKQCDVTRLEQPGIVKLTIIISAGS